MPDEKKPGNGRVSITAAIASLASVVGLVAWVATVAGDQADTKRRVTTIESRQAEDRETIRRDQTEIKQDMKEVKADVQTILRKLVEMETIRRAERRHSP